jgi:protein SCO1
MCIAVLVVVQTMAEVAAAEGEGSLSAPREVKNTEIVDKRGSKIPDGILLTNQRGDQVGLSSYFNEKNDKPVILTLGYYRCPMLCNLVLNGVLESLRTMSLRLGKDFRMISVSIDPKETPDLAKNKRANYLNSIALDDAADWEFYVGEESQIRKLADAIGFQYKYHERSREYIHSAGIFILSPDGTLSRTLYGINYRTSDVKMSLIDAGNNKIGSLLDRVILSCFNYNPDSHTYGIYIFGIMRIGGLLTILAICVMLFFYWRSEKRLTAR